MLVRQPAKHTECADNNAGNSTDMLFQEMLLYAAKSNDTMHHKIVAALFVP